MSIPNDPKPSQAAMDAADEIDRIDGVTCKCEPGAIKKGLRTEVVAAIIDRALEAERTELAALKTTVEMLRRESSLSGTILAKDADEINQLAAKLTRERDVRRQLEAQIEDTIKRVPASGQNGELFWEHYDGNGEPAGIEHVDSMSVISCMVGTLTAALAASRALDQEEAK